MPEPELTISKMTLIELQGEIPEEPVPVLPMLTSQLVRDVVADLINVELHNGYHGIARNRGLLVSQVKLIDSVRRARIQELTPEEIEELIKNGKV